jgi:hypothetical protein
MSRTLREDLVARAKDYEAEWQTELADDSDLVTVRAAVSRRRRVRAGVAVASAACLVLVAGMAIALQGERATVNPIATDTVRSPLSILGDVGPDDAVLTVGDMAAGGGVDDVVVVHAHSAAVERMPGAAIREALGAEVAEWPSVRLVAVDPSLARAVFVLDNPLAYVTPRVAVYSWAEGATVAVVDPCNSPLSSIDLYRWCPLGAGAESSLEPSESDVVPPEDEFVRCVSSGTRLGQVVSRTCAGLDGMTYLYLTDLGSAKSTAVPLGPAPVEPPMVVGGVIYANSVTTEGDPVLVTSGGVAVEVGGAPAEGLGVLDGQLLVLTSSDRWGAESTHGRALGLWSPATDEFRELAVPLAPDARVGSVAVAR